ncbi:hypothetical protein HY768_03180 [candidate division TA06 bacterium]|uniref:Asparagine synthetase domain-containing protein n=1 Tax=candidate division TA06 bacterium TaxID=2250710 RepID=A0A933I813_UNCT6|nr:hypothetical protein [candidate division TA06 bacterium]
MEIRVPWVDVKLFRTLLPSIAKGELGKGSLLSTVADMLPPDIGSRKKTGFSVPVREWLMKGNQNSMTRGLRKWAKIIKDNY